LKRSTYRLARVLIWAAAIILMVYVTLDTIYFHVFFPVGNALVPGVILALILIISIVLLLFVQQRGKRM
jgi:hypothetical protein